MGDGVNDAPGIKAADVGLSVDGTTGVARAASLFLPFLPMLATQILLNNLLYDFSEIGIPFDDVHAADIGKPQRWRMQDIVRFAAVMGPLSSHFDLVTFAVLYLWFGTGPATFRTGWFLESIATQALVIFLIRTVGRPWRDLPNPVLTLATLGALTAALATIVVAYLAGAELLKSVAVRSQSRRTA